MTKQVRVENADTSTHKVIVEVWDRRLDGKGPDVLAGSYELANPAQMTEQFIHSTRYLIVREAL